MENHSSRLLVVILRGMVKRLWKRITPLDNGTSTLDMRSAASLVIRIGSRASRFLQTDNILFRAAEWTLWVFAAKITPYKSGKYPPGKISSPFEIIRMPYSMSPFPPMAGTRSPDPPIKLRGSGYYPKKY